jgi:hypothetical protein
MTGCESIIVAGGASGGLGAILSGFPPALAITGAAAGGLAIGSYIRPILPTIGEGIADFLVPHYSPVGTNTLPHPIPVPIPTPGPLIPPAIPDITNQPNTGNPNPRTPNAAPRPERLPPPSEWNLPQPATPPISTTGSPILPQPITPPFPPMPFDMAGEKDSLGAFLKIMELSTQENLEISLVGPTKDLQFHWNNLQKNIFYQLEHQLKF